MYILQFLVAFLRVRAVAESDVCSMLSVHPLHLECLGVELLGSGRAYLGSLGPHGFAGRGDPNLCTHVVYVRPAGLFVDF